MNRNKIIVGCLLLSLSINLSGCASLENPASNTSLHSKNDTKSTSTPLPATPDSPSSDPTSTDSSAMPAMVGFLEISSEESRSEQTYEATEDNVSTVLVKGGGKLSLSNSNISKKGSTSNNINSTNYGLNSALLTTENSLLSLSKSTVSTSANGASGVFAFGKNATSELNDVTITTDKGNSKGLDAASDGIIRGDTVNITTTASDSPAIATGTTTASIDLSNSKLDTSGPNSPCIYSNGSTHVKSSTGNSSKYNIAVLDGTSTLNIEDCNFTTSATGYVNGGLDSCGIMLYHSSTLSTQSDIGNLSLTNTTLSIDSSSMQYLKAPMFFVTNGNYNINLTNSTFNYGSNTLFRISGNDGLWGETESNGGNVTLTATNQTLKGDIILDKISSISMNLTNSNYEGSINGDNSAKRIDLILDKGSTLSITSDCYVTSIQNENLDFTNVKTNGHILYYDSSDTNNSWLDGTTLTLPDGGIITPDSAALSTE